MGHPSDSEIQSVQGVDQVSIEKHETAESHEVFQQVENGVQFRTVGWVSATIILLKITFSLGILGMPGSVYELGAVPGALVILGWGIFNSWLAYVSGDFRQRHPHCHNIGDICGEMAQGTFGNMAGHIAREGISGLFVVTFILCIGSSVVGLSTALNAVSDHAACTVWFAFAGTIFMTLVASIRTLKNVSWTTWVGFLTLFVSVFIVVVAVTIPDRPTAAPQTGPFDLGFRTVRTPTFNSGMVAVCTIFVASSGHSAFLPVYTEMRRPQDFKKALFWNQALVNAMYISFVLVVYAYCGQYVTNPALGSAGGLIKKISYGIALPGIAVSGAVYQHIAAKTVFVRVLRGTKHLQHNTWVHWTVWLSLILIIGVLSFILSQAISVFNYILALTASFCFGPMAIIAPGLMYLYDFKHHKRAGTAWQKALYYFHFLVVALGFYIFIAGTYATIESIKQAYASGAVGSAFDCADNSGLIAGS